MRNLMFDSMKGCFIIVTRESLWDECSILYRVENN
jgi:hypothetical protein